MQPRMKNPAMIVPGALEALQRLGSAARSAGVPETTLYLVETRASQINGCSICLDMHSRELKAAGEPDERVFMVGAWRETPYFSDAERAALALTEAATRLADQLRPDPRRGVGARRPATTTSSQLAGLVIAIAAINALNRINATTRQITGQWVSGFIGQAEAVAQPA